MSDPRRRLELAGLGGFVALPAELFSLLGFLQLPNRSSDRSSPSGAALLHARPRLRRRVANLLLFRWVRQAC